MASRLLSEDEVQRISWRMKSARMLTGLTQENFSAENDISVTSLKCWEMGRAVPRQEGLSNYLNAIRKHGIEVSHEWIFHGSGPGPTYVDVVPSTKRSPTSDYLEQQIKLFQGNMRSRGLNPIVIEVADDAMSPVYSRGDIVGGFYVEVDQVRAQKTPLEIQQSPWLIGAGDSCKLVYLLFANDANQLFYRSSESETLTMFTSSLIGKVCWHHRNLDS